MRRRRVSSAISKFSSNYIFILFILFRSDGTVYIAARYTPPGNDAREGSEIDMNRCNNLLLIHICNFYIVLERNVRFECAPLYISRMRTM